MLKPIYGLMQCQFCGFWINKTQIRNFPPHLRKSNKLKLMI